MKKYLQFIQAGNDGRKTKKVYCPCCKQEYTIDNFELIGMKIVVSDNVESWKLEDLK